MPNPSAASSAPSEWDGLAERPFSAYGYDQKARVILDRQFPSYLMPFETGGFDSELLFSPEDTHFGYVHEGAVWLRTAGGAVLPIGPGMAFSAPGALRLEIGPGSKGLVVSREGWRGLPVVAGPLEDTGRLKYIDGCTDSLLIPPVRKGDPCLNLLHFPPGIDQTPHVHPSDRIGLILSGRGLCHMREKVNGEWVASEVDLVPGMVFCIHTNGRHKFSTPYGEPMRVLAYHPESDFGPTDEDHPMINKTLVDVDGTLTPASQVAGIHTQ